MGEILGLHRKKKSISIDILGKTLYNILLGRNYRAIGENMRNASKRMAVCAMMAAICVVLLMLGAILELGMYAAPLFAGLFFIPVGEKYGRKYHTILFVVSAILCFLLVPNLEESLLFAGLFGWYPIVRPTLQKLPKLLRLVAKLVVFNAAVIAVEYVVIRIIAPETIQGVMLWVLLVLGNVTFLLYDRLIPKMQKMLQKLTKRL